MSDEIPVGSPPAPHGRHAAPGGWYADPAHEGQERYWDGWQWSRNVRPQLGRTKPSRGRPEPQDAGRRIGAAQEPAYLAPTGQPSHPPQGQPERLGDHQAPGQPIYRMVAATADGVPLAGWWWRVVAFLIDFFLVYAVVEIISRVTGWSAAISRAMNANVAYLTEVVTTGGELNLGQVLELASPPEATYVNLTTMVIFVVYSGLMLRSRGATLGKMVCRLRVVPLDQGRSTPGLPVPTAWLRPLVTKLLAVLPFVQLVDLLFPLWDKRRQTLHDKLVRTQVIREERRPSSSYAGDRRAG